MANDVYGGTYRLINGVFSKWGITHTAIDMSDPEAARNVIASTKPKVVWIETPSNPMLKIIDIAAMVEVAHASGAIVVVDNTFATPALQQPLSLGADAVVHSTTKYLGGHSDVVGGAVILPNDTLAEQVAYLHNAAGAIASPFDSYLTVRGIKTLAVRMDRHSTNAGAIAQRLQAHPAVEKVFYPGLISHVGHDIARAQMSGFGGMISITVNGGEAAARHVVANTHLFTLAESLGGVESLIEFPFAMTHASVAGTSLAVPENLVRLSVGIEDVEDLTGDIVAALDSLTNN
jgi:cystathionine gamma-synthase